MFKKKVTVILLSAFMIISTLSFSPITVKAIGASGWQQNGTTWNYLVDGTKATNWIQSNGKWYYFKYGGEMVTGWYWDSIWEKWYYLNPNGDMAIGWKQLGTTWYYLNSYGNMATGWIKNGASWYYLNANGDMAVNRTIGGYRLDSNGAWLDWIRSNGKWYYSNGEKATGWIRSGAFWYFLSPSGAIQTGWVKTRGTWYFLSSSGTMQTGWIKSGASWYFLNVGGDMAVNTITTDGYYVTNTGAWEAGMQQILTVKSINPVPDTNVAYGTEWDHLGLPATVTLNLNNGTSRDVSVIWRCFGTYNAWSAFSKYTFIGGYNLPTDITGEKPNLLNAVVVGANPNYADLKIKVQGKVSAYEELANGDLSTQLLVDVVKIARLSVIPVEYSVNDFQYGIPGLGYNLNYDLNYADGTAFWSRIDAADTKVANAQSVIDKTTTYADLKATVENKVLVYEGLANGDLSTQLKIDVAVSARIVININLLTIADQTAFKKRIVIANTKVSDARLLWLQSQY